MNIKYRKINVNLIIGIILLAAVLLPVITGLFYLPYDVNEMNSSLIFAAPSIKHLFGTDNFGRDIFSRIVSGAGTSYMIAAGTVAIGAVIGTVVGALTGYFGGIADEILMRVNDTLASFPSILLALVVVSVLDLGSMNIVIALGLVFIPSFARIMRSEFLVQRERDYVKNAQVMGASALRIIFVHILPNTYKVLLSTVLVGLNNAILAEAGLSYLGLGVLPPTPSLGRMLAESQTYIFNAPWYVILNCGYIILTILGITLIGENLGVSGVSLFSVKRRIEAERIRLADHESDKKKASKSEPGTLLSVSGLTVSYIDDDGLAETIKDISFEMADGEILGIVGESGSGKSLLASALLGILPDKAAITHGSLIFENNELLGAGVAAHSLLRGSSIAMVFQEPQGALNPLLTIGNQLEEVIKLHPGGNTDIRSALLDTGLTDIDHLLKMYPHELSGGMKQRICIAMALLGGARLIIADEPTTALDKDSEAMVLKVFSSINKKYGTGIILISHDLSVISSLCSRALIMKNGRIDEELTVSAGSFSDAKNDYAKRLLDAAYADKIYKSKENFDLAPEVLKLTDYGVAYPKKRGYFGKNKLNYVVSDVNLAVKKGMVFGIVGKSGGGKSTLVKAIAGINKYTKGSIEKGFDRCAMVFQDPAESLNPYMSVERVLREAVLLGGSDMGMKSLFMSAQERKLRKTVVSDRIDASLADTGLSPELKHRNVAQLSGGQKQRVAIALALLLNRDFIILDEPVSAVDVTLREQIVELLMELKEKYVLTFLIISHDRRMVERICDSVYNI